MLFNYHSVRLYIFQTIIFKGKKILSDKSMITFLMGEANKPPPEAHLDHLVLSNQSVTFYACLGFKFSSALLSAFVDFSISMVFLASKAFNSTVILLDWVFHFKHHYGAFTPISVAVTVFWLTMWFLRDCVCRCRMFFLCQDKKSVLSQYSCSNIEAYP